MQYGEKGERRIMRTNYKYTVYACYIGYIIQGIINNVSPILFVSYQKQLGISLEKIGLLIAVNFCVQIITDLAAAGAVDKIGYRASMVFAHIISTCGLLCLGLLPVFLPDAFVGLLLATVLNGIGGGLLEVLVSPIVEAAPSKEKDKAMSMLHSFYCWGCVGFVGISTILLHFLGLGRWYLLPVLWCVLPFLNCFLFSVVPINTLVEEEEKSSLKELVSQRIFWLLFLLMICAGASEMAMSQWASYFAEVGLSVNKTWGDLLGPCMFCLLMGGSRLFYGKSGEKVDLQKFMIISCILCIGSYLLAVFAPHPLVGLLGCALCGLSVGILWPGTFSMAAKSCPMGGTMLFAMLAFAGDIGCASGPAVVSTVSGMLSRYGLKAGLLAAIVFPALMLTAVCITKNMPQNSGSGS